MEKEENLREVAIDSIKINPFQPRRSFALEEIEELAESIRSVGIIHPPLVRPIPSGEYELIAGERRYRAAVLAGLKFILVIVREGDFELSAQAALIENIQRVDLNPLEIATALRRLVDQFGWHQDELARRIGKKDRQ